MLFILYIVTPYFLPAEDPGLMKIQDKTCHMGFIYWVAYFFHYNIQCPKYSRKENFMWLVHSCTWTEHVNVKTGKSPLLKFFIPETLSVKLVDNKSRQLFLQKPLSSMLIRGQIRLWTQRQTSLNSSFIYR